MASTRSAKSRYRNLHQIIAPVFVMGAIALVIWYVLDHTAQGRYLYATGLGGEQARLAGVRTNLLRFVSLIVSALLAGVAGVLVTAIVGAGSPSVGPRLPHPCVCGRVPRSDAAARRAV